MGSVVRPLRRTIEPQMQLASGSYIPDGLLAARTLLNGKPRHGVTSKNPAPHPGIDERNSTTALGFQAGLLLHQRLRDYLAVAEAHPISEMALDVRSVATALRISPTTLYKYGFNDDINAAERRQRENALLSGTEIEKRFFEGQLEPLRTELEKERERNRQLVGRIAVIEANAGRLGIDPEELYRAILKPVRIMSRASLNMSSVHRQFCRW